MDKRRASAPDGISVAIWRTGDQWAKTLPQYMTQGASGCDLAAALAAPLELTPGQRSLVPTGVAIALPPGLEAQVRPRSGLAVRQGLTVLNAPGTIDSDFRGEIRVALVNLGQEPVVVAPGDRIAQLVVAPVLRVAWHECSGEEAAREYATTRGKGGFGHTGISARDPGDRSDGPDE